MCHTCITSLTRELQKEPIQVFFLKIVTCKKHEPVFKQLIFPEKEIKVCVATIFRTERKVVFQQENHRSLSRRAGKRSTVYPMWYIFFYSPLARRKKGVDPPFSPSPPPGLCIHLLFPPHPWGGTWPRIFTLLTMVIRPAWHLIQKNSLKTRLKMALGTPLGLRMKHKKTLVRNLI